MEPWLEQIPGARALHDWFGYWPSFHDAEVVSISLNRESDSTLSVHTWQMTDRVDERGFYVLQKHVKVEFTLNDISALELSGFNDQNVLFGLVLSQGPEGYELQLDPCYGLAGSITAKRIAIQIEPQTEA